MNDHSFGQTSTDNLFRVFPPLVAVAYRALYLSPLDFGIHSGMRSKREQKHLVEIGASWTLDSQHRLRSNTVYLNDWAYAIDYHVYDGTQHHFNLGSLRRVFLEGWLPAAEEIGLSIIWGGSWETENIDGCHIEAAVPTKLVKELEDA